MQIKISKKKKKYKLCLVHIQSTVYPKSVSKVYLSSYNCKLECFYLGYS